MKYALLAAPVLIALSGCATTPRQQLPDYTGDSIDTVVERFGPPMSSFKNTYQWNFKRNDRDLSLGPSYSYDYQYECIVKAVTDSAGIVTSYTYKSIDNHPYQTACAALIKAEK